MTEVVHLDLIYLSRLFCYKIQTEKAARGHNGSKIEEEGEDTEPSLLRVFVGAGELG